MSIIGAGNFGALLKSIIGSGLFRLHPKGLIQYSVLCGEILMLVQITLRAHFTKALH